MHFVQQYGIFAREETEMDGFLMWLLNHLHNDVLQLTRLVNHWCNYQCLVVYPGVRIGMSLQQFIDPLPVDWKIVEFRVGHCEVYVVGVVHGGMRNFRVEGFGWTASARHPNHTPAQNVSWDTQTK